MALIRLLIGSYFVGGFLKSALIPSLARATPGLKVRLSECGTITD